MSTSSDTTKRDHQPVDRTPGDPIVSTAASPVVVPTPSARLVVDEIGPQAADSLRRHVEAASGGGSRLAWFLIGFVAAVIAGVVAAVAFLAVSDADDDGNVRLDVPAVEVDVES